MDTMNHATIRANKATTCIPKLQRVTTLLASPKEYLAFRHQVLKMLAQQKLLHYMALPINQYQHYMNLPDDAPLPIQYVRPDIEHYGDDNLEFTIDQLKLITKTWDLMDAIALNLVNHLDASICTHIRHHVNVDVATLSELMAALDAEFLAPGLRALPELYTDLRTAQGITSISELLQYIKYLGAMQLMAAREEDPTYVVDAMSACLNVLGYNAQVVRYHELRGNDAEDATHFMEFLTAQQKLMSYKRNPDTPTPSGILNPIMASNDIQIAGLAEQVRLLTIKLEKLNAPAVAPTKLFCSTHGPCAHTSDKCNTPSLKHNLNDTLQAWSNQAQFLARPARKQTTHR